MSEEGLGRPEGQPCPGACRQQGRETSPSLSAEKKALGWVSSCPLLIHGRDGVLASMPLSAAQKPVLVQPLEEAFAELVGADHDGAGGAALMIRGRKPAKSPLVPDSARILRSSSQVEPTCRGSLSQPPSLPARPGVGSSPHQRVESALQPPSLRCHQPQSSCPQKSGPSA